MSEQETHPLSYNISSVAPVLGAQRAPYDYNKLQDYSQEYKSCQDHRDEGAEDLNSLHCEAPAGGRGSKVLTSR